jgi:pyrroloquinoline quinone (PQQ) biosynthesis protein C
VIDSEVYTLVQISGIRRKTTMLVTQNVIKKATVVDYIEQGLERIRKHPFITEANSRTLTEEQAIRWIMCAGRESRSFPDVLNNLISRSSNPRIQDILKENLKDENGDGVLEHAHFMHYLQLLDKLQVSRDDFYAYNERAGIKLALSLAYNVSVLKSEAAALGYMLINESMTTITYSATKLAITRYYPNLSTGFFDIHVDVDEEHVDELYKAVDELDVSQLDDLLYGIDLGERGMAVLLDEAYGIFENYDKIPSYTTAI